MRLGEERYNSLNRNLRDLFGKRVVKISLDAGFTCPNRDGILGVGGCAFCSPKGSGDFVASGSSLRRQFEEGKALVAGKWPESAYIPYFQAFTNTYAPVGTLAPLYEEALSWPGVVGLAVATRPDCLPDDTLDLLEEISRRTFLWVELGLQTVHQQTASAMGMGYDYGDFLVAANRLASRGIRTVGHVIFGLPGESMEMMRQTAREVASLRLWGIKIHLFYLLEGTRLAASYRQEAFPFLTREAYTDLVIYALERMSPEVVIHRLTGDPPRRLLIGPEWSTDKRRVLNDISAELARRDTWQGRLWKP